MNELTHIGLQMVNLRRKKLAEKETIDKDIKKLDEALVKLGVDDEVKKTPPMTMRSSQTAAPGTGKKLPQSTGKAKAKKTA